MLRSLAFNLAFFGASAVLALILILALPLPRAAIVWGGRRWAALTNFLLIDVVGATIEIRGAPPPGPCIIASKHESVWETAAFPGLLNDACFVLKRELVAIPLFGWLVRRNKHIIIDRRAGATALRGMLNGIGDALAADRQVVIFPEGTRVAPGDSRPYQAGIAAIYKRFPVPVVPVALTSGTVWGRRSFIKRPGRIILEFLEPVPSGLDRRAFEATLRKRIEEGSARLRAEVAASQKHEDLSA